MMSLQNLSSTRELIRAASKELGIGRSEAELVIATLMNRPRLEIYLKDTINEEDRVILWSRIQQLKNGIPIEYVTKRVQFRDYTLSVQPGVFIPRIETESFVELLPKILPRSPERVLEIGTGCGAISIALAQLYPDADIIATDISEPAIVNAVQNIRSFDLKSRIHLLRCDMFEGITGKFDLIVSNPPYVPRSRMKLLPKSVREFEPLKAIDGGEHGVQFIEKLVRKGMDYLAGAGVMALEIDEDSVKKLKTFMVDHHVGSFVFRRDLFNKFRFLFIGVGNEKS
jgi:release factor glutamine methyltransferase